MKPQELFVFRILPAAGLSTALLLFSVHHLLNANNAATTANRYRMAAALAQQDLRMPAEPLAHSSQLADIAPAQAARPWPQAPELGKRNDYYNWRTTAGFPAAADVGSPDAPPLLDLPPETLTSRSRAPRGGDGNREVDAGADAAWLRENEPPADSSVDAAVRADQQQQQQQRKIQLLPGVATASAIRGAAAAAVLPRTTISPAVLRASKDAALLAAAGNSSSRPGGSSLATSGSKVILLWTTWFDLRMWWFKTGSASFTENHCPVRDCYATNDRAYASRAQLILFQASRVVYKVDKKTLGYDIPRNYSRSSTQIWAFATRESPLNTYSGDQLKPLDGLMNVTMTYKRDSDIVFPFSHQHVRRSMPLPKQTYGAHRKKLALWFVSNCRPRSKRLMLAQELQKYLGGRIDIFGKCSNRTNPCGRDAGVDCEKKVVPQYKFYLAFENSICRDYITEKFFHKLYKGAVPVVYGTSQADYSALAPPDSYLHVDNFTSVASLAAYMLKLDADNDAYDAYHRWREQYDVTTRYETGSVWGDFVCAACQLAHEGVPQARQSKPRYDLSTWFSPKDCKIVVEKP